MRLVKIYSENRRIAIPLDKIERITLELHDRVNSWEIIICASGDHVSYEFESSKEAIQNYEEIIKTMEDLN